MFFWPNVKTNAMEASGKRFVQIEATRKEKTYKLKSVAPVSSKSIQHFKKFSKQDFSAEKSKEAKPSGKGS